MARHVLGLALAWHGLVALVRAQAWSGMGEASAWDELFGLGKGPGVDKCLGQELGPGGMGLGLRFVWARAWARVMARA